MNRGEILARFEAMLDAALQSEDPPAGVDGALLAEMTEPLREESTDTYSMWSAVTALTQEVKLQGRAFQDLNQTLAEQPARIQEELRSVYAEREKAANKEIERRIRREVLTSLIDLRDRMIRGLEAARGVDAGSAEWVRGGLWQRVTGAPVKHPATEAIGAIHRGYELALERLDQTLNEYNAHEIRCLGEMFDPRLMNAIDSEETLAVDPGTVLEVYRSGYEWGGEVFRTAQVKVARRAASAGESK